MPAEQWLQMYFALVKFDRHKEQMTLEDKDLVPLSELVPPDGFILHQRFLDYWLRLRGDRVMPSYRDLDPVDIPWALAYIFVLEVTPSGDFVYRIASDGHSKWYRRNLKGAKLEDIMQPEDAEEILGRWRMARDIPAGFFVVTDHRSTQGVRVLGERMVLPMGQDNKAATHLVGVTKFAAESELAESLLGDQQVRLVRWSRLERPD